MHTVRQRVLDALAHAYERSVAGRTGRATRYCRIPFHDLTRAAACADGDLLEVGRGVLADIAQTGILRLRHPRRDQSTILAVEIDPSREEELFELVDRDSPSDRRKELAAIFSRAESWNATMCWQSQWQQMCHRFAEAANAGRALAPFSRVNTGYTAELLRVTFELLQWKNESLMRFASCQLFGTSKQLEEWRSPLETILSIITEGEINGLGQLGILETPRSCVVAGPAIIHLSNGTADLQVLSGPITLSMIDLHKSVRIETPAKRFCTIENLTTFHELSKSRSDTLFACSEGYVKPALREFIARLDAGIEMYHFGDSDPSGFDILRHGRAETGRNIASLHMNFRPSRTLEPMSPGDAILAERLLGSAELTREEKSVLQQMLQRGDKGDFEQERLGIPRFDHWPFY